MINRSPAAARILCALVVAAGATVTLGAQRQERAVYVSALDRKGVPVEALSPSDVVIREDNAVREVLRIGPASEPMQIAVLVDNSTAAEGYVRDYRTALPPFIQALMANRDAGSRNELALITLAERPTIVSNYTTDPAQVVKGAERIFASPQSAVYLLDGIMEVSRGLIKRGATRPVIVAVVTEGPELSDRIYQQVLEPLQLSGAQFHVVTLGNPRNELHDRAVVIDRGTKESGGSYEVLLTGTALENYLKTLARQLTQQFRVTYSRPQSLIPPEKITVTTPRADLVVRGTPVIPERAQERR